MGPPTRINDRKFSSFTPYYLLEHGEWDKVIALKQQILQQGAPENQAGTFYNLLWAYLENNQVDDARLASAQFQGGPSGAALRACARSMSENSPNRLHSRISELLLTTPSASGSPVEVVIPSAGGLTSPAPFVAPRQPEELFPDRKESADFSTKLGSSSGGEPVAESGEPKADSRKKSPRRVEFHLGGWYSGLDGKIDSKGTSLDIDNDVSSDRQTAPEVSARFSLGDKDWAKVSYVGFSFDGTLNKAVVHNLRTYSPGTTYDLKTRWVDIEGFHDMSGAEKTTWEILFGGKFSNSELEVTQYLPGLRQVTTWENTFGFPYIGLASKSRLGNKVGFDASLKWFSWGGNAQYLTHDLELKLLFGDDYEKSNSGSKWLGFLGYRDFRWAGRFNDESGALHFSGPIFGVEWHF